MNPTKPTPWIALAAVCLGGCASDGSQQPMLGREPTTFAQRNLELEGKGGLAFLADGRLVLSEGPRLRAYEWPSARAAGNFARPDAEWSGRLLATSRDGKLLAASLDRPEAVVVFDAADGRELARLELDSDPATALAFAPAGGLLAIGTAAGQVTFLELPSGGKPPAAPRSRAHGTTPSPVTFVAFSSDEIALSSSVEGTLRGWDARHAISLWTLPDTRGLALDLAEGRLVVEHVQSATLELCTLAGRTLPHALRKLASEPVPSADRRAILLAGDVVAFTSPEEFLSLGWQNLCFVSLADGRALTTLRLGSPRAFAVDPDARYLIVSDGGKTFAYDLRIVLAPH